MGTNISHVEGMFIIQTKPFYTMENMKQYEKNVVPQHFIRGVLEVHVVFDSPSSLPETPKELIRAETLRYEKV